MLVANLTAATVSRCGMVWFSDDILTYEMLSDSFLSTLKSVPIFSTKSTASTMKLQEKFVELIKPFFADGAFIPRALHLALSSQHTMVPESSSTIFRSFL